MLAAEHKLYMSTNIRFVVMQLLFVCECACVCLFMNGKLFRKCFCDTDPATILDHISYVSLNSIFEPI